VIRPESALHSRQEKNIELGRSITNLKGDTWDSVPYLGRGQVAKERNISGWSNRKAARGVRLGNEGTQRHDKKNARRQETGDAGEGWLIGVTRKMNLTEAGRRRISLIKRTGLRGSTGFPQSRGGKPTARPMNKVSSRKKGDRPLTESKPRTAEGQQPRGGEESKPAKSRGHNPRRSKSKEGPSGQLGGTAKRVGRGCLFD